MKPELRIRAAVVGLCLVLGGGTLGYWVIGLSPLDALYQTVITVSTVGSRPVPGLTTASTVFTIVLVLVGVATVLYAFGVILEAAIEGQVRDLLGRRRMERRIEALSGHVIICGWGRIGRAIADHLHDAGESFVVIDVDHERLAEVGYPYVLGDATDDSVLERAGVARARALVAATSTDATNLYLTLSGRSLKPDIFIVARARLTSSEEKMTRAGADRVVNPQAIGGSRMAALILQPHVAEFVDVVTHRANLEFRLAEVEVSKGSSLVGRTLRDAHIRDRTGALVLAIRSPDGDFLTNPGPEETIDSDRVLIAIGTTKQLLALEELAESR
ncbi:MAG TPA: potassium channel protein [Acidimicrobiales bacterium]|nr:potassium channel protein [Acidimicrobiales bacterium]